MQQTGILIKLFNLMKNLKYVIAYKDNRKEESFYSIINFKVLV